MPSHLPPPRLDQSRAPSLQRVILHAFAGTMNPSDSLPAPRDFRHPALYPRSFARLGCQVGSLLFRALLLETCHRPIPRKGPAVAPVQSAVCCLRRDMTGSALSNTFRLIICRGCSVHLLLRPASLLPALSQAFDAPLWPSGSLLPAGACYRALRRLPGRISHPLEQRVLQDAP